MRPSVKCGFADVRIFEVVKCGEILRILSADVMGDMRMLRCGYADMPPMKCLPSWNFVLKQCCGSNIGRPSY